MRWLFLSFLLLACDKDKADPTGEPKPTTTASTPADAPPAASSAAEAKSDDAKGTGSFSGKFEAKASELYLPDTKEMARKWRTDESDEGLGPGELTLSIADDGTVTGTVSGALGALILNGHAEGDIVTATLTRAKDDHDGYTGTLQATRKGAQLEGEMNLTRYNANTLRRATFTLDAK